MPTSFTANTTGPWLSDDSEVLLDGQSYLGAVFPWADGPTGSVLTFAPPAGEPLELVGVTGTGFTGAIAASIGGVPAAFVVISDTRIVITVPASAITGLIAIVTALGTATSIDSYIVALRPIRRQSRRPDLDREREHQGVTVGYR